MKKTKPSSRKRPKPIGASSHENAPQVVVRAGKHYVCSACGTWVEIPADVVGQLVYVASPANDAPPSGMSKDTPEVPSQVHPEKPPEATPPVVPTPPAKASPTPNTQNTSNSGAAAETPSRQPTSQTPPRKRAFPRTFDGLQVPSGRRLDHAFAWVRFQLQVLDRQDSEIKQLRKLLRQRRRQFRRAPATVHSYDDRPISKTKRPKDSSPPANCHKEPAAPKPKAAPSDLPVPVGSYYAPAKESAPADRPIIRGREPP